MSAPPEPTYCDSPVQPCAMAVDLHSRLKRAEYDLQTHAEDLADLRDALHDVQLGLVALKIQMAAIAALGALVGSSLGAILTGWVVFKITKG